MGEFLEERISVSVKYGATYGDDYAVEITTTASGAEYRRLIHPYPVRSFRVDYIPTNSALYTGILNIYHRAFGKFAGFRAKAHDDFTTNGLISTPTSLDQTLQYISLGVYQLIKEYGIDKSGLGIGRPKRIIYKPVANTTLVSVGTYSAPATMWSVNTITGRVTFVNKVHSITWISKAAAAIVSSPDHTFVMGESIYFSGVAGMTEINGLRGIVSSVSALKSYNITGISKAASAIVTFASHTFLVNEVVSFSGISGMTQMNGLNGMITAKDATTITVNIDSTTFGTYSGGGIAKTKTATIAIDSSGFTPYVSGGAATTQPQIGEVVKGGCEFDIPVRFNGPAEVKQSELDNREITIELIELLNP